MGQEKSPVMRQEMPKGLRPLDWVYRCFRLATCLNTTSQNQSSQVFHPVPGDVLQGDRVLHSELVGLTLYPRLLDQHTCICCQTWQRKISTSWILLVGHMGGIEASVETCKCHQHMLVQLADLAHCSAMFWLKYNPPILFSQKMSKHNLQKI